MSRHDGIKRRLGEVRLSAPSPDLRARVLAAAAPLVERRLTWSDRMWFSRGWRIAAASVFVVLLALNWWPPSRATMPDAEVNDPARATITAEAERLASELNMTVEERTLVEEQLLRQFEAERRRRLQPVVNPEGGL